MPATGTIALLSFYVGLHIGDIVVLDTDDVGLSDRKGNLRLWQRRQSP